jgi:hypothetical protein
MSLVGNRPKYSTTGDGIVKCYTQIMTLMPTNSTVLVDGYKYGDGEKLKRLYMENLTKSKFAPVKIIQRNRSLESML